MTAADETVRFTGRGIRGLRTATFETVEGKTDRHALHEVWDRNDYRLRAEDVVDGLVVDIGANLGGFSVLAAQLGARHVLAYEPHPETFQALLRNVAGNDVSDRVECLPYAVVDSFTEGPVALYRAGGAAGTGKGRAKLGSVEVETVPFEDVLEGVEGRVALLKIDIEGGEYELFETLSDGALSKVDRIAAEFHGPAMPHLAYLSGRELGPLVCRLSEEGTVEIRGKASRGGLLFWTNYEVAAKGRDTRRSSRRTIAARPRVR